MKTNGKHTPEPWVYRPNKYDDWGFIRDTNGVLVAVANDSTIGFDKHDEYRATKSDPYKPNGSRIVACVNACAGMDDPEAEIQNLKKQAEAHRNSAYKASVANADLIAEITSLKAKIQEVVMIMDNVIGTYNRIIDIYNKSVEQSKYKDEIIHYQYRIAFCTDIITMLKGGDHD